ncbi:MAG: exosortase-associated EpsI family protein [Cephaloticoccus sp.]|nr:exosortase-associated EpsI family protein [Cephaloticoccus sp.]MCF7760033.1 exosortase-associated EpsI family protein [Cephaloticoccus sp.]
MTFIRELQQLSWLMRLNVVLLTFLFLSITALLWPSWNHNPDLSHGLFMPVLFLLLVYEARQQGPRRYPSANFTTILLTISALVGGLCAMVLAGLFSTSVGWNHTLVIFSLTCGTTLVFFAGLLVLSNEKIRLIPLNWTSLVALGLWLLCAPIPPGTYSRLTLHLQLMVSQHVLTALHLLGVAASRQGNIIELANTSVGVAEACSGVRSLISCIFAGFFFSATLVSRPWARTLIIILAAPLALVMNFLRSLILTLLANRGIDISGSWHDVTGFAVLGVTAAMLGGLALLLEQKQPSPAPSSPVLPAHPPTIMPLSLNLGLIMIMSLGAFFYVNTHPVDQAASPPPALLDILPSRVDGWRVETSTDLYQFSGILETDNLAQRTYHQRRDGVDVVMTVYLAYWEAGKSSVSQVAMHTPDACWPGSGWIAKLNDTPRELLQLPNQNLPMAEARIFQSNGHIQHVWFWHIYNGRPIAYENPYSVTELLRSAWRYGFTRQADQLFVRVSSDLPWDQLMNEPLLIEIFSNLKPLGL